MRSALGLWGIAICNGHLQECIGLLDEVSSGQMLEAIDVWKIALCFASESLMKD